MDKYVITTSVDACMSTTMVQVLVLLSLPVMGTCYKDSLNSFITKTCKYYGYKMIFDWALTTHSVYNSTIYLYNILVSKLCFHLGNSKDRANFPGYFLTQINSLLSHFALCSFAVRLTKVQTNSLPAERLIMTPERPETWRDVLTNLTSLAILSLLRVARFCKHKRSKCWEWNENNSTLIEKPKKAKD